MRPTKGAAPASGMHAEPGRIRDVVYAGTVTRYIVELDRGGELQVVQQNLEILLDEALAARGRAVLLGWRPDTSSTSITRGKRKEEHEKAPQARSRLGRAALVAALWRRAASRRRRQ